MPPPSGSAAGWPVLALDGGVWGALIRGSASAGLFAVFGELLFSAVLLPPDPARTPDPVLLRLNRLVIATAIAILLIWAATVAALMAGSVFPPALPVLLLVAHATAFGHLVVAQLSCLLLSAFLSVGTFRPRLAAAPAALALLLQAGHGHAFSMNGAGGLLRVSDVLHLLAGGAWLGGLPPLLLAIRVGGPMSLPAVTRLLHRFSIMGRLCVAAIAATALIQATVLVGSVPALLHTAYGWTVCCKLAGFLALLGFACVNQFRLLPRLHDPAPDGARRRLQRSVALETVAGLGVLLAAGTLGSLPPGMHMDMG